MGYGRLSNPVLFSLVLKFDEEGGTSPPARISIRDFHSAHFVRTVASLAEAILMVDSY
jgi:hypothetical protein